MKGGMVNTFSLLIRLFQIVGFGFSTPKYTEKVWFLLFLIYGGMNLCGCYNVPWRCYYMNHSRSSCSDLMLLQLLKQYMIPGNFRPVGTDFCFCSYMISLVPVCCWESWSCDLWWLYRCSAYMTNFEIFSVEQWV